MSADTLSWLVDMPAGNVNFTHNLERSDRATIEKALDVIAGRPGSKTKELALRRKLKKLIAEEHMRRRTATETTTGIIDPQAQAANDIYNVARMEADAELQKMRDEIDAVREESQAIGVLQKIDYDIAHNEFLRAMTLVRIKASKEYRKGGLTWEGFCDQIGIPRRTADLMIEEIGPVVEKFSASLASLSGYPLSKIRYLGRGISANLASFDEGCIVYGDERIPLDDREGVQALIEKIESDRLEAAAEVKAKDRLLESKENVIKKQEKELSRYEDEAMKKGYSTDEDAFIKRIETFKTSFDGYLLRLDPENALDGFGDVSPRMRAALISAAHYMKMQALALYDTVTTTYGNPAMNPELLEDFERWSESNLR